MLSVIEAADSGKREYYWLAAFDKSEGETPAHRARSLWVARPASLRCRGRRERRWMAGVGGRGGSWSGDLRMQSVKQLLLSHWAARMDLE